jgi:ssDNA-binding Zn-finger/Zn-ribbon topoisomerase 1
MTQEALKRIAEKLRRAGASLPAPELTGTIEGSVVTGLCIALALVEGEIEALAQPEQEPVAVYGYCPTCGAKGVMRERRPNGSDKCANGHTYPSSKATTPPQRTEQLKACVYCGQLVRKEKNT